MEVFFVDDGSASCRHVLVMRSADLAAVRDISFVRSPRASPAIEHGVDDSAKPINDVIGVPWRLPLGLSLYDIGMFVLLSIQRVFSLWSC